MGRIVERISLGLNGAEANGDSRNAVVSADGRYIVFESDASNLVADDTNGVADIFRYDAQTGEIVRVSVGVGGGQANAASANASVSADGRYVVFDTAADNLVTQDQNGNYAADINGVHDVFMRDIDTGMTMRISQQLTTPPANGEATGGTLGSRNASILSINGDIYVTYVSDATNLVGGDTNDTSDVFVTRVSDGNVFILSNTESGTPSAGPHGPYVSTSAYAGPVFVFTSKDPNITASDGSSLSSVFLTDGQSTLLVSGQVPGESADASVAYPYIAFTSNGNLTGVVGTGWDGNGATDVVLFRYITDITTTLDLVSQSVTGDTGNGASGWNPRVFLKGDGTPVVTFSSLATDLIQNDTNGQLDFFVRNMITGELIRLSEGRGGLQADGASSGFTTGGSNIANNGSVFVFNSAATNLVDRDSAGFTDIFRVNLDNQAPVSTASAGTTSAVEQIAVVVDAGLTLSDADSPRLNQASVSITGNFRQGQDVLSFANTAVITGSYNAATGVLTLTGRGTVAEYQAALRTVTYLNTADAPAVADRTISISVDDGADWSAVASKTLTVTPVNDAPTSLALSANTIAENSAAGTVIGILTATDPDGSSFTFSEVADPDGMFAVSGNRLLVIGLLDYETKSSHSVTLRVTDQGGLSFDRVFSIGVTDVAETSGGVTSGTAATLFGSTVSGMGTTGTVKFTDTVTKISDLIISGNEVRLASAGATSTPLTLQGDFTNGKFFLLKAADGSGFELFFQKNLADVSLVEGVAVSEAEVNGAPHPAALTGDGSRKFQLTLSDKATASDDNALGVYEVDANGNIVDVRILFASVQRNANGTVTIDGVEAGNKLGFFIVQGGLSGSTSSASFVDANGSSADLADGSTLRLKLGDAIVGGTVFHAYDKSLNFDGLTHARSGADPSDHGVRVAFEDLLSGGDRDFQDVVFRVDVVDNNGDFLI